MTRDVDATFVPHGVVLEEARNVAEVMGLPTWWLNEQASAYVSTQQDDGKREVFDHPGIRVMAASAEHVFAMKAFAARSRDEDDLRTLANIIGINAIDAALELCEPWRGTSRSVRAESCGQSCRMRISGHDRLVG